MNVGESLLRAVLESPADDAPRLVYADWLEERGDAARAEFIRLQCRLARPVPDDSARPELEQRQQELLEAHQGAWAAGLQGLAEPWEFRRGFVEAVTLSARTFLERGAELFGGAPVRRVALGEADGLVADLAACPHLARLAALHLTDSLVGDEGARALAGSPHLAGLAALQLHNAGLGPAAAAALAGAAYLGPALTSLALGENRLGDTGAQALAGSARLANLTALCLGSNGVGDEGARALAASPHLARLRELWLENNALGPAGVAALAGASGLVALADLVLRSNGLGDEGARALAGSLRLPRLARLDLGYNGITEEGVEALAGARGLAGLATLDLSGNYFIGDGGARALATSPHLAGLKAVSLMETTVGPAGAATLRERFGPGVWR